MRKLYIGLIAAGAILLILLSYFGIYFYSLSKVTLQDVKITQLKDVDLEGFTFGGDIILINNGWLDVEIKNITYDIILEINDTKLGDGVIQGKKLPKDEPVDFPFSTRISWVPSAELAVELLESEEVFIALKGDVHVTETITLPIEEKIDIKPFVDQFVETKLGELKDVGMALYEGIKGFLA